MVRDNSYYHVWINKKVHTRSQYPVHTYSFYLQLIWRDSRIVLSIEYKYAAYSTYQYNIYIFSIDLAKKLYVALSLYICIHINPLFEVPHHLCKYDSLWHIPILTISIYNFIDWKSFWVWKFLKMVKWKLVKMSNWFSHVRSVLAFESLLLFLNFS